MKKLTAALMASHDKDSPPDGLIKVHFEMELVRILEVSEISQTLSVLLYIKMVGFLSISGSCLRFST